MFWPIDQMDFDKYIESCKRFVLDDKEFNNFKKDPSFRIVLEHTHDNEARGWYLPNIKDSSIVTESLLEKFSDNDLYGSPEINFYPGYGLFSPSTLRYIKQAIDIFEFVGDKNISSIFEVGGGYGGLCKTISCTVPFNKYYSSDMNEVNALSDKYLLKFPEVRNLVEYIDCKQLQEVKDIDLFVSNYALAELSIDSQKEYFNKVIKNSKYFYITYNYGWQDGQSTSNYRYFLEMAKEIFDVEVEVESRSNKILYGTNCLEN